MNCGKEELRALFAGSFDEERWTQVLADLFGVKDDPQGGIREEPQEIARPFPDAKGWFLGSFTTSDGYLVGLFRFDARAVQQRRVGLRNLLRPILRWNHDAALAVFTDRDSPAWRFSFVCDLKDEATAPKRFTYVFGDPSAPYRTPVERFLALRDSREAGRPVSFAAMTAAFSVEALSDEFFRQYKEHYETFVSHVTGKRFVKEGGKWVETEVSAPHPALYDTFGRDDKLVRDYVKKLLGRLVFLQFLQKKGWMGAKNGTWTGGDPAFLLHLFERSSPGQKDDFLDAVLEKLFFEALNTDRTAAGDRFDAEVEGFRKVRIPYLNGGLFERDALDALRVKFPADFFGALLRFFSDYNFTIDENDADEAEVGIDPEMLGRIFENLLEDNKDKGAFYTPKEIVRYMCRQSLLAHLSEGEDSATAAAIAAFLDTRDPGSLPKKTAVRLAAKLRDVKICDPAIGSGAFPMGLLRELFALRSALEPAADGLKRQIIENNIYGVDIEKGAVDIARLRFWLALVVDADAPTPLPNLDFKIMQGNSLVESWKGHDLSGIADAPRTETLPAEVLPGMPLPSRQLTFLDSIVDLHRQRLRDLLHEWFACSDHRERASLRKKIHATVEDIFRDQGSDITLDGIDPSANAEFFLWHLWFAEVFDNGGFDIVIGNPPYIKEYENRTAFDGFRETSPYYIGKMDLFHGFACHGIDLLKTNGLLCFIAQNNWTTNAGAKKMRNKVVSETRILELLDFNAWRVFNEAGIQTMIMLFLKSQTPPEYTFRQRFLSVEARENDYLSMLGVIPSTLVTETYPRLLRSRFKDKLLTFSSEADMLDKLEQAGDYLIESEAIQGIVPALDDYFLVDSPSKFSARERQYIKPFHTGLQGRYCQYPVDKFLIYMSAKNFSGTSLEGYPSLEAHFAPYKGELRDAKIKYGTPNKPYFFVHRERDESFFIEGPKVISQIRCDRPRFYYTEEAFYPSRALFVIKTTRWNMKFLTGLLNSALVAFWLRHRGKMQGHVYKIDKEPLLGIPIPRVTPAEQNRIARLVDRILSTKTRDPEADTTALESEIDALVYQLYGLTPEEITTVEHEP